MVDYYEPTRLRRIQLGIPTCSARTRRGTWALYPNGADVVVVWPGGTVAGPPAEVDRELDRLAGTGLDDRACARAISQFLTDPAAQEGTPWPAIRPRTRSIPAAGYRISGLANQHVPGEHPSASWPGAPARPLVAAPVGIPRQAQPEPSSAPPRAA